MLGPDRGGDGRFEDAARFLEQIVHRRAEAEELTLQHYAFRLRPCARGCGGCLREAATEPSKRLRRQRQEPTYQRDIADDAVDLGAAFRTLIIPEIVEHRRGDEAGRG